VPDVVEILIIIYPTTLTGFPPSRERAERLGLGAAGVYPQLDWGQERAEVLGVD